MPSVRTARSWMTAVRGYAPAPRQTSRSAMEKEQMAATSHLEPIPHPPGRMFVANLFDLDPHKPMESLMKLAREYGPIYQLATPGSAPRAIVSGFDLVDELCDESRFDKML